MVGGVDTILVTYVSTALTTSMMTVVMPSAMWHWQLVTKLSHCKAEPNNRGFSVLPVRIC
jgi:hypothetical protein